MDRRAALAASGSTWAPTDMGAITAWYYAASQYITDVGGEVDTWADRSGNGYAINNSNAGTRPLWEPTAWGGRYGVRCALGTNEFLGNVGALGTTLFSGSAVPFSVITTCAPEALGLQLRTIWSWDDNIVQARSSCYITTTGLSGYRRRDDSGTEVVATAAGVVAEGHRRLIWSFSGTTVSSWIDGVPGMVNASCNVGACTFARSRLAEGPESAADAFRGIFLEVIVLPRVVLAAEPALYQAYSLREWGP